MTEAPKKLSEAIQMALDDQVKAEAHPELVVDMDNFHDIDEQTGKCHVCFAGAVMHYRHGPCDIVDLNTDHKGPKWNNVYYALDCIREGSIKGAMRNMGIDYHYYPLAIIEIREADFTRYEKDKNLFRETMENYVEILKRHNL